MAQAELGLDLAELKKKNTSHGKDFSKITCSDAWVIGLFSFGNRWLERILQTETLGIGWLYLE